MIFLTKCINSLLETNTKSKVPNRKVWDFFYCKSETPPHRCEHGGAAIKSTSKVFYSVKNFGIIFNFSATFAVSKNFPCELIRKFHFHQTKRNEPCTVQNSFTNLLFFCLNFGVHFIIGTLFFTVQFQFSRRRFP